MAPDTAAGADDFWAVIRQQIDELTRAKTADDVVAILSDARNPYHQTPGGFGGMSGDAFFAGSGGDDTVRDALYQAGWTVIWSEASYYYAMRAPDGSAITYVEGDIYRRNLKETR